MTALRERAVARTEGADDDAALLARIGRGDVSALGLLFDRHEAEVRRVVARLGAPRADIDDLVQQTFLDVLRLATSYDGRASARPWLLALAVTRVRRGRRTVLRLAARFAAWANEPRREPRTPEEAASSGEELSRVQRALEGLSPKKREVIVLAVIEGLPGEEVARVLDIPVATVWTRLHHARRELMDAMFEEES